MSITDDLNWLKTHVILLLIVGVLTFGGVYGVESLVAKHDAATAAKYESIAADAAKQNAQIQAQTQAQIAQLASQNVQLEAQISQLSQAISNRDAELIKQQAKVPTLTPVQVASSIQPFLSKGTATAQSTGEVLLDKTGSQEILVQLEELPVDRANMADLSTEISKQNIEIVNLSTSNGSLQTALTSEKTSHTADNEANAKEVTKLKADARKSKLKWFGIGVVVGFIGRGFAGF
jgi:hypothetical protein